MLQNNQTPPTLEKLDRFLMSKGWDDIFPRVMVRKLPRELSDHNPLILTTENKTPLKNWNSGLNYHGLNIQSSTEKCLSFGKKLSCYISI
jgi:hypothetical protein